jgi:hypothetical protein
VRTRSPTCRALKVRMECAFLKSAAHMCLASGIQPGSRAKLPKMHCCMQNCTYQQIFHGHTATALHLCGSISREAVVVHLAMDRSTSMSCTGGEVIAVLDADIPRKYSYQFALLRVQTGPHSRSGSCRAPGIRDSLRCPAAAGAGRRLPLDCWSSRCSTPQAARCCHIPPVIQNRSVGLLTDIMPCGKRIPALGLTTSCAMPQHDARR